MAALLPLLAFLLITGAGAGPLATADLGTHDATVPNYSSNSEVMAYWQRVLPNSPMPPAIVEHLSTSADNEEVSFQQGFRKEREDEKVTRWGSSAKEHDEKVTFQWGTQMKGDDERATFHWGSHTKDDGKVTFGWGPNTNRPNKQTYFQHKIQMKGDDGKETFRWGLHTEEDDGKATLGWGPATNWPNKGTNFGWKTQIKGDDGRVTFHWGSPTEKDEEKVTLRRGLKNQRDHERVTFTANPKIKGNDEKVTFGWGQQKEDDVDHKATFNWGSSHKKGDDEKATFGWGPKTKSDDQKVTNQWSPNMDENIEKAIGPLGSHGSELSNDHEVTFNRASSHREGNDEKATFGWGSKTKNDDHKVTYQWGPDMDGDIEKVIDLLETHANGDDDKVTLRWRSNNQNIASLQDGSHLREGHHHQVHGTGHNHGQFNLANILFLEAVLTPGTLIAPYIEPSVLPGPFLRHEIADSIPISTNNFTDILSMFAPMSLAMAGKIWSTLHTCEHPHPLEGEQQACATSIESMVELAASVLRTRDLRAFSSSPDVPAEGFVPSPSSNYKVAAVRAVTSPGEKATTMTCHGMTFPYAVFYCHGVNPTRVYEVTLKISAEQDVAEETKMPDAKKAMQVLAVCHLDTSQFDPANPFFVARGLKPGDTAVCHFLSRDSVLWAPAASTQGHEQVAAR